MKPEKTSDSYTLVKIVRCGLFILSLGLLAAVLLFPPVKATKYSSDWDGLTYKEHARFGFEPIAATWQKDEIVCALELILIALVAIGTVTSLEPGAPDATSRLARAALILHSGTILLPLAVVGSDTVYILRNPALVIFSMVQLVPQMVLCAACIELVGDPGGVLGSAEYRVHGWNRKAWVWLLAIAATAGWTIWSFSKAPMFIISFLGIGIVQAQPLSGIWAGAVAMWLTLAALTNAMRGG